jgi:hypothetical protein
MKQDFLPDVPGVQWTYIKFLYLFVRRRQSVQLQASESQQIEASAAVLLLSNRHLPLAAGLEPRCPNVDPRGYWWRP